MRKFMALIGLTALLGLSTDAALGTGGNVAEKPVYVVVMTHVEGDRPEHESSPTCVSDLRYQTDPLPLPGVPPRGTSFAIDIAGTELLHEILQKYADLDGKRPMSGRI